MCFLTGGLVAVVVMALATYIWVARMSKDT